MTSDLERRAEPRWARKRPIEPDFARGFRRAAAARGGRGAGLLDFAELID